MIAYNSDPRYYLQFNNKTVAGFEVPTSQEGNKVINDFSEEWKRFGDKTLKEIKIAGDQYFDLANSTDFTKDKVVLDLGCGFGRWTRYLAEKVQFIEAVDPGDAIFSAAQANNDLENVRFTQASIENLPFPDESFDVIVCLGVIHHVQNHEAALATIYKKLKPGGTLFLYTYYNFDNRSWLFKNFFKPFDFARSVICKLPYSVKHVITDILAVLLYLPGVFWARLAKALLGESFAKIFPLYYYHDKSFNIIRNDSLDRFGTRVEKRFTRVDLMKLLRNEGFEKIRFSDFEPFWHLKTQKPIQKVELPKIRKSVLFVAPHRFDRCPSQRFRYEQYLDFLEQQGYDYLLSGIIDKNDDAVFYQPGNLLAKLFIAVKAFIKRSNDLRLAKNFDFVFIQREAYMLGTSYFERKFSALPNTKVIYDFDDAIWLQNVSQANKRFSWLKNPKKTEEQIKVANLVLAGNNYLKDYALQFNKNVVLVPTTVNTTAFDKKLHLGPPNKKTVTIGWSGSNTTIEHFKYAIPFLKILKEKYGKAIDFKVIGDASYTNKELGIQGIAWTSETEVSAMADIDIGIMPLPNDEWAKGKCGLKGLTYMALEIATIMSPVGVNSEIIQHGENGFLAETTQEWVNCIELLINDSSLREKLGKNARKTVEQRYSVEANKQLYINALQ